MRTHHLLLLHCAGSPVMAFSLANAAPPSTLSRRNASTKKREASKSHTRINTYLQFLLNLTPRIRLANSMSFGIIVTRFAWICKGRQGQHLWCTAAMAQNKLLTAHRFVSSKKCTMKSSVASCRATKAGAVHLYGSGDTYIIGRRSCCLPDNCSLVVASKVQVHPHHVADLSDQTTEG